MQQGPTHKQCPACGQPVLLDAGICPRCGHQFRTQFTPPPNQTQAFFPGSQPPPNQTQAFGPYQHHPYASGPPKDGLATFLLGLPPAICFILGFFFNMIAIFLIVCYFGYAPSRDHQRGWAAAYGMIASFLFCCGGEVFFNLLPRHFFK